MPRLVPLALLLAVGCSSHYPHVFYPAPLEVEQGIEGNPQAQARALVSILGIRRPDKKLGRTAQVEVRLRLENLGATPLELVADSLTLVAADLRAFDGALLRPEPDPIPQDGVRVYDLLFPFPSGEGPDDYDLKGINLGWSVDFGGQRVKTGVTFERAYQGSSDPRVSFGFGFYGTG
jgi:hypothetical protein